MASFSQNITTAAQLHSAETATYLTDAVIGVVFIVLILIVANMTWFWILGVATLFTNLAVDYFNWMRHITKAQFTSEYTIHMIAASVVGVLIYGIVTFAICKMQKKDTKLASMF